MALKTERDVDDLHRYLAERSQAFLRAREVPEAAAPPPPTPADLPTLLQEARADLAAATRERDEALRRADLRVAHMKQRLAALEAELKRVEEVELRPETSRLDPLHSPEKPKPKPKRR